MTPHELNLKSWRGDGFYQAVPMLDAAGAPLSAADMQAIREAYPEIYCDVVLDGEVLFSLSAASGELSVEMVAVLPRGPGPALVFRVSGEKMGTTFDGADYDVEFDGPGVEPRTWLKGTWVNDPDTTRRTVPPGPP